MLRRNLMGILNKQTNNYSKDDPSNCASVQYLNSTFMRIILTYIHVLLIMKKQAHRKDINYHVQRVYNSMLAVYTSAGIDLYVMRLICHTRISLQIGKTNKCKHKAT